MREIKLRYWDNIRKCYARADVFHLYLDGWSTFLWSMYSGHKADDIIVEQYTGREDDRGKPIYEGDILKFRVGAGKWTGIVYWDDSFCGFNVTNYYNPCSDDPNLAFSEYPSFTIIGNIRENPILAKKAQ